MRKIKFKGKLMNSDEWMYGGLLIYPDGEHNIFTPVKSKPYRLNDWNVQPDTIGQYIGLKDSKGTEIYEGDIIAVNGKYPKVIQYRNECAAFCMANLDDLGKPYLDPWQRINRSWWTDYNREIEVIGNIHDQREKEDGDE